MYFGGYFFLIVIGALLRWAVTYQTEQFDIQAAGLIIMIVGIVGLAIAILFWFDGRGYAAPWRGPRRPIDDTYYGPAGGFGHDRVVHEHVARDEPRERVVHEAPPRERVVRDYVPPPRDPDGRTPADWPADDTPTDTLDRTRPSRPAEPARTPPERPDDR